MIGKKVITGISIGDLHGIGLEVIINSFQDKNLFKRCIPIIFCPHPMLHEYLNLINVISSSLNYIYNIEDIVENKLNILHIEAFEHKIELGKPSQKAGLIAYKSLEKSCLQLKNKKINVLITAPIDKYQIRKSIPDFIGHTEYLENQFEGNSLMVMLSEKMKIAFITGHIPLNKVSEKINTQKIINKTIQLNSSLKKDFNIINPKIAVLGLNPHAGENDMLGTEESTIISPAIKTLKEKEKIIAEGPFSADSFFTEKKLKKYDGIIAMYHDQGLIPFKTLSFYKGVNFTAGLEMIRTSPVHGVAYDIAGKNRANSDSFKVAIYNACDVFLARNN